MMVLFLKKWHATPTLNTNFLFLRQYSTPFEGKITSIKLVGSGCQSNGK
jgi:hypothetical protein